MANIQKGRISSVLDAANSPTMAQVIPDTSPGQVTPFLTVPWWLRGEMGGLRPNIEVLFVEFDAGGMILSRADGELAGPFLPPPSDEK